MAKRKNAAATATATATPAKVKRERRDNITAEDFLRVYVPMAKDGKSATEIGEALGRDKTYVTVRASQLRATFKDQGQDANLIPNLQGRKKQAADLAAFVQGLNKAEGEAEAETQPEEQTPIVVTDVD